jgi:hypothetical protein
MRSGFAVRTMTTRQPLNAERVASETTARVQAETSPARHRSRFRSWRPPSEDEQYAASRPGAGRLAIAQGYKRARRTACALARCGSVGPVGKAYIPSLGCSMSCPARERPRRHGTPRSSKHTTSRHGGLGSWSAGGHPSTPDIFGDCWHGRVGP